MMKVMMINAEIIDRRQMNEEVVLNDLDEVLQLPRMLQQQQQRRRRRREEEEDGFDDDPSSFPPDNTTGTGQLCTIQPWEDERPSFLQFVNTASIRFLHERIPRFGNSKNITEFIIDQAGGGSGGETDYSYIRGLAGPCLCIVAVAILWAIILLICRYVLRTERAGWLSGRFRPLPPRPKQKQNPRVQEENKAGETERGNRMDATESYSNKIQGDNKGERNDDDEEAMRCSSSVITDQNDVENDSSRSTQQQNQGDVEMSSSIRVQRIDEEIDDRRLSDLNDEISGKGDDSITDDHHFGDYKERKQEHQQSTFARFVESFLYDWFGRNEHKNVDGSGKESKMTGSYDTSETMTPSGLGSEGTTDTSLSMLPSNYQESKGFSSKRSSRHKDVKINDSTAFHLIHDLDAAFHVSFKEEGTAQEQIPLPTTAGVSSQMTPRHSELRRLIHDLDSAFHISFRGSETVQIEPSPVTEAAEIAAGTKTVQTSETEKNISMKVDLTKARTAKTLLTGKMMPSFRSCDGSMTSKFGGRSDDLQDGNAPEYPRSSDESSQYQKQQEVNTGHCDDDIHQSSEFYEKDEQLQYRAGEKGEKENDDEMSWIRQYNRVRLFREFFRAICCVCALAVIVGTILMIIQGYVSYADQLDFKSCYSVLRALGFRQFQLVSNAKKRSLSRQFFHPDFLVFVMIESEESVI